MIVEFSLKYAVGTGWIVEYEDGSCRQASDVEITLWRMHIEDTTGIHWYKVVDKLPESGSSVLMAYDDSPAVLKGKYFKDLDIKLSGFAIKSASGTHYVQKPGVKYWMYCPKSPYEEEKG